MGIAGPIFKALGQSPESIDIGGGLGIPYTSKEKPLNVEKTADAVASAFEAAVKKYGWDEPELVMEPGRYLVGNAGWLLAQVTRIKKSYRTFVGLDAGMQTLLRPALYGATHRVSVVGKTKPLMTADLCGPICESTDVFFKDLKMPKVEEGDLVVFHDAGAYGYSMASSYNGRPRPAEVLVNGSSHKLIRRRETLDDLSSLCV
jgi:diaminopimelate decarboxylase